VPVRIALYQLAPTDPESTLRRIADGAALAIESDAEVLVLPEDTLTAPAAATLQRLQVIAGATGLAILLGITEHGECERNHSVVLITGGRRGRRGSISTVYPHDRARSIVRIRGSPFAVLIGFDWLTTSRVRRVLADRSGPRALMVLTKDVATDLQQRAQELAASDAITVIVCNAAAPDGRGGSCVVIADGEVALACAEGEQLAVVDLVRPRASPLEGLAARVNWSELPPAVRTQVKEAVVLLIGRSENITTDVSRQATGGLRRGQHRRRRHAELVAHRQIVALWDRTLFAELWRRLDTASRDKLITELKGEIDCVREHWRRMDYHLHLTFLEAPHAWSTKGPVVGTSAGSAIFWKAVRSELSACLQRRAAATPKSLRQTFETKIHELRDQPASVFYLTYPYLQAVARNFLRDGIREAGRPGATHGDPTVDSDPALGLSLRDFYADLTPLERDVLRLRLEDAGMQVAAMAVKLARSAEDVERALLDLARRAKAHL
jgi:predicted amidohydrolase